MRTMSSTSMRMTAKRNYLSICTVLGMMLLTLYMAFAFPFTLFQLKQTETTELKSVIIVGRSGEKSPTPESYFMGEEPPEDLNTIGYEQLTNVGKERMYLLGKFLKLRYYHLLLNGNPRMLKARSADLDRALESTQALMAGLNPPKDNWLWSTSTDALKEWQPKAIHTTSASSDDLLSISPNCYRLNQDRVKWKNSTKYMQLLNEFRHDLQTLRTNTGLEFEDDLEMLSQIEDSLRTRKAFKADAPAWYTQTFADRLAHIADVATGSRFSSAEAQRLYVGRLLEEIVEDIKGRMRLDQELYPLTSSATKTEPAAESAAKEQVPTQAEPKPLARSHSNHEEPKVIVYMTDKQRLSALLNSLQIYTSQPQFGSLLLIELHHDPINRLYFLRLYTVSSASSNVFPEPLRVNPLACADSTECLPQQFEQNIRHLMLDRASWQDACNTIPQTSSTPSSGSLIADDFSTKEPKDQIQPDAMGDKHLQSSTSTTTTTHLPPFITDSSSITSESSATTMLDKLDDSLIVGPTSVQTDSSADMAQYKATEPQIAIVSTTLRPQQVSDSSAPGGSGLLPSLDQAEWELKDRDENGTETSSSSANFIIDPRADFDQTSVYNQIDLAENQEVSGKRQLVEESTQSYDEMSEVQP